MRARRAAPLLLLLGCDHVFSGEPPPSAESSPAFVAATSSRAVTATSLTYRFDVVDGEARALLVSVHLGGSCSSSGTAAIASVAYGGAPLQQVTSTIGTPCQPQSTRSDQWLLVAPPIGSANVTIELTSRAESIHSGAMYFTNVAQTEPVRASAVASGVGPMSEITVTSELGDLVVNTVGHGAGIASPGDGATLRFLQNVDAMNTLNNSGGSTASGLAPSVTMTWTFTAVDEWQTIASSLKPMR